MKLSGNMPKKRRKKTDAAQAIYTTEMIGLWGDNNEIPAKACL